MPRDFTIYWDHDLLEQNCKLARSFSCAISRQLEPISKGDIVWLLTIKLSSHQLFLAGRLNVGRKGSNSEDVKKLLEKAEQSEREGKPLPFPIARRANRWFGSCITAMKGTAEKYRLIPVSTKIVRELRFTGTKPLKVGVDGWVDHLELVNRRELTPESARRLGKLWSKKPSTVPKKSELSEDFPPVPEGRKVLRQHLASERNRTVVAAAKRRFRELHNGRLTCEVCHFSFLECYGDWGNDYIEAHHKVPFSELKAERKTRIEDLAMVCSNCHSMLHRRPWPTLDELRAIVKKLKRMKTDSGRS